MRNFKDLKVWSKAHHFVLEVYSETTSFPSEERFALTQQLRKAASSIATNIAEGCGRGYDRDFARFLGIAAGSASEVEYQLLLSRDLGYIELGRHAELDTQVNELKRMLNSFIQSLRLRPSSL
jgi:four helix bundle protein